MKKAPRTALACSALALLLHTATPAAAETTAPTSPKEHAVVAVVAAAPMKITETDAALRDLWVGHVFWVRNVVVATLAQNKEATTAAENAVVTNAKQIAASITPFYGVAASDKLFSLLAAHYGATKQYLEATVAANKDKQTAATKALTDNVAEIAVFLSGANPYLPKDAVEGLYLAHVAHHQEQIQQLHDKQYKQETETWESMKAHMYGIADALTEALAKQFPEKLK